ncbi:MAG: pyridoxamine 5'-phosphate oxidase family protein [Proteobacteria bacterium]|nr:pyridoxamine 5'-phosphate oxidase family protein [Pseudomonadota bacterium]
MSEALSALEGKAAYLASAGADGAPHLAVGEIERATAETVHFRGWFCPRTLENLEANRRVALAAGLGPGGVQVAGTVVENTVDALLDGCGANDRDVPQVRFHLVVQIEAIMAMTDRAHTDRVLG